MFESKKKKAAAFVLSAFMTVSIFGTAIASAHPADNPGQQHFDEQSPPKPHHRHHNRHWIDGHFDHGQWIDGHWDNDHR